MTMDNVTPTTSIEKFIDVEKVISQKSKYLMKVIPGFIIRYLKKILHEDRINQHIIDNKNKYNLDFIDAVLKEIGVEINTINIENLPSEGNIIIASNHPLGGLDGMGLIQAVGKVRKSLKFLVNDLLLNIDNLKGLFIPINKLGKASKETATLIEETYKSEAVVLNFPFGLVSRKRQGNIIDLEWKKSFLVKAKHFKRDIIPVHIDGKNSNFFYWLSNTRKRLGIKANIEMFFLVNEMYKQENKTLTITFGQRIPYQYFDNRHSDSEWSELLRKYVYQLSNNPNAKFIS